MALHADLEEVDLHENKGVSTASANTVATANGAGATVWQKVDADNLDTGSIFGTNRYVMNAVIDDISTAGTVYLAIPCACTLTTVFTSLQGTIATADSTIDIKNDAGTSMGTITVSFSGSAAGDNDNLSASMNNTFIAGDNVLIVTDGASTNTIKLLLTLVFTITGSL